jgi:hypothetical protein
MVSDYAVWGVIFVALGLAMPSELLHFVDYWQKEVSLIIRIETLNHRHNPFEAHPRIDMLCGQEIKMAGASTVVLNEDQIPEFDKSRAI